MLISFWLIAYVLEPYFSKKVYLLQKKWFNKNLSGMVEQKVTRWIKVEM